MGEEFLTLSRQPFLYTEKFCEIFPYYLAIGMTYRQFWHGDPMQAKYYREADEIRQRRNNFNLWLQGRYVYEALCDVSPLLHAFAKKNAKARPYLDEPYALSQKEYRDQEDARKKREFEKMLAKFNARVKQGNQRLREASDNGRDD